MEAFRWSQGVQFDSLRRFALPFRLPGYLCHTGVEIRPVPLPAEANPYNEDLDNSPLDLEEDPVALLTRG
jgi:hypothetical protein